NYNQGQYICFAQNEYGSDKLVVTLSVVAYPTRILEKKMRDIKVLAGKTVHLECRTEGRPVPIVSWILPNHTEVKGSITEPGRVTVTKMGTLTIQDVSVLDSGHYKCIASNPAGTDTATVRLQVVATPPAILEEKRQLVRADIGQNLFLACSTYGDPRPTTHWVLHDVGSDEEGDYTCYAENKLGKDKMHVHISVVTAVPHIQHPNLSYAKVKPGGNVRFDCKAIGEPKPKVFWMLPSKDMIAASNERYLVHANGSLDIRNVKLADAGEYVCMARNAAGEENKVYKLDIDGNPPIINASLTVVVEHICENYWLLFTAEEMYL
uniref:Immunoglobulin superfamily, member 10 n=1 Tax=Cyprinus carpio TaxID=7962 RepID=A0A8C2K091_CYPCA